MSDKKCSFWSTVAKCFDMMYPTECSPGVCIAKLKRSIYFLYSVRFLSVIMSFMELGHFIILQYYYRGFRRAGDTKWTTTVCVCVSEICACVTQPQVIYKSMLRKAPTYLSSLVNIAAPTRSTRASRYISLVTPKANSSFGRLSFQFSAANDWNELQNH